MSGMAAVFLYSVTARTLAAVQRAAAGVSGMKSSVTHQFVALVPHGAATAAATGLILPQPRCWGGRRLKLLQTTAKQWQPLNPRSDGGEAPPG